MKSGVVLFACVLLLCTLTVLASKSNFGPAECCFGFYDKRLKKDNILSYSYTDTQCPKKGVLFTMKSGRVFCVKPSAAWVPEAIDYINNRQ